MSLGAKKDLDARLAAYAEKGREVVSKEVHFETWTLRYNRMHWVTVDGLQKHWERARVDGEVVAPNSVTLKTSGVTALMVRFSAGERVTSPRDEDHHRHRRLPGSKP